MTATSVRGEPHGGVLVNRFIPDGEIDAFAEMTATLPSLVLTRRELCDLELLANGGFSPLTGFMREDDYRSTVRDMRLANGLVWSIPITLAIDEERARGIQPGSQLALRDAEGGTVGLITVEEVYRVDPVAEATDVFRTTDADHPGVAALYAQGSWRVAGPVEVARRPLPEPFTGYNLGPAETRAAFATHGWQTIVGFQTRNPVHRAHEYIQKVALETVDGLLLHPLVGETKSDDIPAEVRLRCYEPLFRPYSPADRVLLAVLPAAMRYAGPREAIHHALIRKNYGCTHFIVGRDHAGVGNYYGPYDAQEIFRAFTPDELGIQPLFFENAFYCRACGSMATAKTCPHDDTVHVTLSGTAVRRMLAAGEEPPPEFTRPEVAAILMEGGQ